MFSTPDGTTETLRRHMKRKHKIEWEDALKKHKKKQPTVKDMFTSPRNANKMNPIRRQEITEELLGVIVDDLRPLKVVEDRVRFLTDFISDFTKYLLLQIFFLKSKIKYFL